VRGNVETRGVVSVEARRGNPDGNFKKRPVLIPCERENIIVDWSSGLLESNVGEPRTGIESRDPGVRVEIGKCRTQADEMLGEYFVLPPGTPPESQWRVIDDSAFVPSVESLELPSIIRESNSSMIEPAIDVAGRAPGMATSSLPSIIRESNSSLREPAIDVAGRAPGMATSSLPSIVRESNSSMREPAIDVAGRAPGMATSTTNSSFREPAIDVAGRAPEMATSNVGEEPAATLSVVSDQAPEVVSLEAADWPEDLMGEIHRILSAPSAAPRAPLFQFKMDEESAQRNFLVLEEHGLDLSKALSA
jgi:hypothetical protein